MNEGLAITSAGQQRLYFEREMIREKNALADAEVELKKTQETTGILSPLTQVAGNLGAIEQTRAQLRFGRFNWEPFCKGPRQRIRCYSSSG